MKRVLQGAGWTLAGLVVVALIAFGIYKMDQADQNDARAQKRAFERANTICGAPPQSIIWHGSGWSNGPWVEVRCVDGTARSIQP